MRTVTVIAIVWILASQALGGSTGDPRPVELADSINMSWFGDPLYYQDERPERIATFSGDRTHFVVVLRRGCLAHNVNVYWLLEWNTETLHSNHGPKLLLKMSSSSNRPAIESVRWLGDNRTIVFLGERPSELHQVFTFNLGTRQLRKVTHHPTNVLTYSIRGDGKALAYVAEDEPRAVFESSERKLGVVVSPNDWLSELVLNQRLQIGPRNYGIRGKLFYQRGSQVRHLDTPGLIAGFWGEPHLSPDGRMIVIAVESPIPSDLWRKYAGTNIAYRAKDAAMMAQRYALIDVASGKSRWLVNAPREEIGSEVVWMPNSRFVVATKHYGSLEAVPPAEEKRRESELFTLEVNTETLAVTEIAPGGANSVSTEGEDRIVLELEDNTSSKLATGTTSTFAKVRGQWLKVDNTPSGRIPRIILEEDFRTTPKIYALHEGTKTLLYDLNPQFQNLQLATVEEVSWQCADGRHAKGAIYYPAHYITGRRYPLVIQTHGWRSERFSMDGLYPTAFAAQALAGRDLLVLQVDESVVGTDDPVRIYSTTLEVKRAMDTYESAIEYLDGRGLIDRHAVGLVGFSRTCLYVAYTLTHSKFEFKAASVTDGVDGGYFQYIQDIQGLRPDSEGVNGGLPYGHGLQSWAENSPGFNLDRVRAPVHITALNPESTLFEWEWYAGLIRLGRPVEMLLLQDGEHILQRPWDRWVSQGATLDWFCFWLKSEEDPAPAKVEQYARWRELRKLQNADKQVPPLN